MSRITTPEELQARREGLRASLLSPAAESPARAVRTITLCGGTGCTAFGSAAVFEACEREIERLGIAGQVRLKRTGCHGFCERGPVLVILPEKVFYPSVQPEDVPEIVERTALRGEVIDHLLYVDPISGKSIVHDHEVPFYESQMRIVFRNNGELDPIDLDDYIVRGGYAGAARALGNMTPEEVIEEVKLAGLRGRGGAGFPTGVKWELCHKQGGREKYLICNADEGDPGAFMDRSLLEGSPHAIIEGIIIGAYAIGATQGIIYVRSEYPLAVTNTSIALEQAREAGLLGENILGTGFSFDVEIYEGAGAFVCGEETALIASLEGDRGMPRPRPPFPAQRGYRGKPTTINNVETLANIAPIILNGHEWYAAIGTEGSKGTKIFALAGKVNCTGLVEVPMGTTLRQIIFEIGGGIPGGRAFKAAQMGGPSGGCVPARYLDLPIDYDTVKGIGAIMGSGGLIVLDENNCMVDMARYFLEFTQNESCGKCVPCRIGTRRMLEILQRITRGEGQLGDLDELEHLAGTIKASSLCGLGQTAPNPVLSTLRYFREEYEEHILLGHCRAAICEALVRSRCQHACPAGVSVPEYVGLIAENRLEEAVDVIRRRNPFVSVCGRVCDHPCEDRCRRSDVDEPLAIRALKRYAADRVSATAPAERRALKLEAAQAATPAEVAIIGAGPAGLSCAYFLALTGRKPVVFEQLPVPGGMLAVGIPEYRLPKDILSRDIDYILEQGVELRLGIRIDSLDDLRREYKAVFVATGAQRSRPLGVEGEGLEGVADSLAFLRQRALGEKPRVGRRAAVVGGGNAAVDAARSARRLGAEEVTLLYRRTRAEMTAYMEEIEAATEEGVDMEFLVAPTRIVGAGGKVTGVELIRMELGETDLDGRRRPVPVEGSEFIFECDMVIPAIGQVPSVEVVAGEMVQHGRLFVDPATMATPVEGVYAGGDCVAGAATVIGAIAAGQRAALAIDKALGGRGELPADTGLSSFRPAEDEIEIMARATEPVLSVAERLAGFAEVVSSLEGDRACVEARRCLRCDLEQRCRE
jgi:NADH-quinone oxidoreductase subunit F